MFMSIAFCGCLLPEDENICTLIFKILLCFPFFWGQAASDVGYCLRLDVWRRLCKKSTIKEICSVVEYQVNGATYALSGMLVDLARCACEMAINLLFLDK